MRTMMKKCGRMRAYAGVCAVALLVVAALVTSCTNPSGSESSGYKPPAGKGAVKLNINKTTRSIVPGTTISSFTKFDIDFSPASTGGNGAVPQGFPGVLPANVAGPYDLDPGDYDITVIGYIGSTSSDNAAIGEVLSQSITANTTSTTSTIYLKAYDPATVTGNGTFSWTISNSVTGLTSANMSFTKILGVGSAPASVNLLQSGNWTGSITNFPAGYYYVDFVLVANSSTRNFRHILQIYKNMISTFSYTFDNTYFTFAKADLPIDFTPIGDSKPELIVGGTSQSEGYIVNLSISGAASNPKTIVIAVDNENIYSAIGWYFSNGGALSTTTGVSGGNDEILTIDTANAPFATQGLFQLTVTGTGTTGGASPTTFAGSTFIFINILP